MDKFSSYRKLWNEAKNKISENRLIIVAGILSILVAFSPYIQKDLVIGSDWSFHLIRIETLAEALKRGEFPVKFHSDLCYGYGYGVGFFYSNLFLYIPAVLMNLGFSLEVAYKLFAGLIFLCIFMGMLAAIWNLTYDKYVSAAAAITYVLSVNVLESFYQHFALGRSLALIFMPMAICGMYLLITQNRGKGLLEAGFIGLVYSHVLSTVLTVLVCIILLLVYIRQWISDKRKWRSLLRAVGIVLAVTAAYWLPLLEQWTAQTYRASQPWTYVDENVVRIMDLLSDNSIGWIVLGFSVVLGFWILEKPVKKSVRVFWSIGIGFFLVTTVYHFWHLFRNIFKFLQFPYRLFSVASVLLIIAFALWLKEFHINERNMKIVIVAIFLLNICYAYQYMQERTHESEDLGYTVLHEEIMGLGAGEEWLPVQTTRDNLQEPMTARNSKGECSFGERNGNKFVFLMNESADYYDVPFVWYKGFRALTDEGKELQIGQAPETGLVRVYTANTSADSEVTVWYDGTKLQNLSYMISGLAVVFLVLMKSEKYFRKII